MYWMTAQEIADELRISRKRIYELMQIPAQDGGLPYYKIGNAKTASKRVKRSDFEKWLEGQRGA